MVFLVLELSAVPNSGSTRLNYTYSSHAKSIKDKIGMIEFRKVE
jgi:hypothetical protein